MIATHPEYASRSTELSSVWLIVSNQYLGPRSGSHSPSATPNSLSDAVPATIKSSAKFKQLMKSAPAIYGLKPPDDVRSNPAITGLEKYGPERHE